MKESPVLWCTECRTSIAQAELNTADRDSTFNYIPFEVTGEGLSGSGDFDRLIVATTRPELLYGCVCLFANPADEKYEKVIGKTVRVPLYNYTIPVLADEGVALDKGTGIVMCATFGDSTDAEWVENLKWDWCISRQRYFGVPFPLWYCTLNVLKLYAIYVPHITEQLYQEFFRQFEGCISLHKLTWEGVIPVDSEIIRFGEKLDLYNLYNRLKINVIK